MRIKKMRRKNKLRLENYGMKLIKNVDKTIEFVDNMKQALVVRGDIVIISHKISPGFSNRIRGQLAIVIDRYRRINHRRNFTDYGVILLMLSGEAEGEVKRIFVKTYHLYKKVNRWDKTKYHSIIQIDKDDRLREENYGIELDNNKYYIKYSNIKNDISYNFLIKEFIILLDRVGVYQYTIPYFDIDVCMILTGNNKGKLVYKSPYNDQLERSYYGIQEKTSS
jgi:hypothetical protein